LADDRLLLIDRSLVVLVEIPLAAAGGDHSRVVAGDPITGGVWLADGAEVSGFDAAGRRLHRWGAADRVASLVYAGPEAIYAASETQIAQFDADGLLRARFDVSTVAGGGSPRLLLDALSDCCGWCATMSQSSSMQSPVSRSATWWVILEISPRRRWIPIPAS
jgi:hypothetical protein